MRTKLIIAISSIILFSAIAIIVYKPFARSNNSEFETELVAQFKEDAESDIKNDDVKTFGFGLPLPPKNKVQEVEKVKTDSILKIYGLTVKNLGCTIMPELTKATEEYEKVTEVYLTKRNGKGWRMKMENEIRKINKNYR